MAKMLIADGVISSSTDYSLYHGTTKVAEVEQNAIRVQGDLIAENYIVSSSVTYMTSSVASGSTMFGNSGDDTHKFSGSLQVSGTVANESYIIGTNVGLGTTNPVQPLHVITPNNGGIEIDATLGAPTLFFDIPGNEQGRIYFQENDSLLGSIVYESTGTDYISFKAVSNTERMRLLGTGKLTVGGNFTNNSGVFNIAPGSGTDPSMYFEQYTSSTGGTLGMIGFGNRAVDGQLAAIYAMNDGATDSAYMSFQTEVTSGALAERLRIHSGGTVEFKGANQKISGSASSTGSFGTLRIDMTEDEIDETANELRTRMTFDSLFEQTDMMIWEISDSYGSLHEMVELVSPSWTIEIPRRIR